MDKKQIPDHLRRSFEVKLELDRDPPEPEETDDKRPLFKPNKRKPVKHKIPKTFSIFTVILALIGMGTIAAYLLRNMKEYTPQVVQALMDADMEELLKKDPEPYTPLHIIEDGVLITLDVQPKNARIFMDGLAVQSNPMRLARGEKLIKLIVWDTGFVPSEVTFAPRDNQTIKVRLKKQDR